MRRAGVILALGALPGLFVSAGAGTLSITAEGDTASVSLHGHVLFNVCAALS